MIFICTAMYIEAEPIINTLNLKKDVTITKFQVFKNNDITLIITGIGKIKAAISLTSILSNFNISKSDLVINIGLCGSKNMQYKIGETFLCNKIVDNDTKMTYFADIVFKHPFNETSLQCCSREIDNLNLSNEFEGNLIDMESTGIYESALTFYENHQILFIKIISDYLNTRNLDISNVKNILIDSMQKIISWILYLKDNINISNNILTENELQIIAKCSTNLKLSCTMEHEFLQIIKYYKLIHGDFDAITNTILNIQCKSKREGKKYLEEIKQRFI